MVNHGGRTETPDDVVVGLRTVDWRLFLITVAQAAAAVVPTATIPVGDDISLTIFRMNAGSDP